MGNATIYPSTLTPRKNYQLKNWFPLIRYLQIMQWKFTKIMKVLSKFLEEKFLVHFTFSDWPLGFWIYTKVIWSKKRFQSIAKRISKLSKCIQSCTNCLSTTVNSKQKSIYTFHQSIFWLLRHNSLLTSVKKKLRLTTLWNYVKALCNHFCCLKSRR